jgi:uncharacterized protein (TIGR03032 family)
MAKKRAPTPPKPRPKAQAPSSDASIKTGQDAPATGVKGETVTMRGTSSFAQILSRHGFTALVSTYQAGQLIALTAESETKTRTAFRSLPSPMGIAVGTQNIAVGTKESVWDYRNQPSVCRRLDEPEKRDACFLPKSQIITGDIRIHEMEYVDNELWVVNTRFSCLATLDNQYSFVPRWRPPFISKLAAEDRCHLNGIAKRDGKIAFASALGTTDTAQGWRENKTTGGVVMEYPSGEVILSGLSMPHSPRWYRDRLWILESGRGAVCNVDPQTGKLETIAELPGFTRGLAFYGPLAFVGLSKVRETNIFGGIQLNERVQEKMCGVWVVDIRNGQTVARVQFDSGVHEIFDIKLIKTRWPEFADVKSDLIAGSFVLPDEAIKDLAKPPQRAVRAAVQQAPTPQQVGNPTSSY